MTDESVTRDERTIAVENASYRWACGVLAFGVLLSAVFRGIAYRQSTWDLLALVVLSGAVGMLYQGFHRTLGRASAKTGLLIVITSAGVGMAIALALLSIRPGQ